VDTFYELPASVARARLPACVVAAAGPAHHHHNRHAAKVRVTRDQRSREVLAKIVKARVADANIYMPGCPVDCRISVSLEMAWEGPVEELEQLAANPVTPGSGGGGGGGSGGGPQPDRTKDGLSYRQDLYQIDLRQVSHAASGYGVSIPILSYSRHMLEATFLLLRPRKPPLLLPPQAIPPPKALLHLLSPRLRLLVSPAPRLGHPPVADFPSDLYGQQQRMEKEHDAAALVEHGQRVLSGQPHRYLDIVEGFLDNVRILARRVRDLKEA